MNREETIWRPRILSVASLLIALIEFSAQGQTYTNSDGLIYSISDDAITIDGYAGANTVLVITNTIAGLPVTTIATSAFESSALAGVTIPNGVTSIGEDAFRSCGSLTNATIPNTVTSIGDFAFDNCTNLTSITIPNALTNCQDVFALSALTTVTFAAGTTSIVSYEFAECPSLAGITIPNGVTSIQEDAFYDSYGMTNVTIPGSVTNIGDYVFVGCTGLTSILVDSNNPSFISVGGVLFNESQTMLVDYPAGLTGSYSIPEGVKSLGVDAFAACAGLTNVTMPGSLTNVGTSAFESCSGLTNVTVPGSVLSLDTDAFASCDNLERVTLFNGLVTIGTSAFEDCHLLTQVNIPDSVTTIGTNAFSYCSSLPSVTIPASVTNIGQYAFTWCSSLTNAFFLGNAPTVDGRAGSSDTTVFSEAGPGEVYYLDGATGWASTFGNWYTAPWYLPDPIILDADDDNTNLGVRNNQFGFTVYWATNLSVIVQAATNLDGPIWVPVSTNTLVNGSFYFHDPEWTNYPHRFYRASAP